MAVNKEERSWSKKECRDRYVIGEEISVRELAKIANRDRATVGRWCSEDNWVKQRRQFAVKLQTKTDHKITEKTSDRISDNIAELNEQHLKGSEVFRNLSQQFAGMLVKSILDADAETRPTLIQDKHFSIALQRYSGIFATAVSLQREALGMDYLHLDKAIAATVSAGLEVTNPTLDLMAQQLQEAGYTIMPPQKPINQE